MKYSFKNIFKQDKKDIDIEMKNLSELQILQKLKVHRTTEQIILEEMEMREKQFEELNLKHSSVPLDAMTRGEIVQHFKIRENALQRLLSGIDPGEFDAPKS